MNIEYLIQLLSNKLTTLNNAKILSFNAGDLPTINSIEEEILGVQNTLIQLKLLLTINTAAISANITLADMMTNGLDAVQNQVQGPSTEAIINGYDISAYATDPDHEQKIRALLNAMPVFVTAGDVDSYIQKFTPGSPLTGAMLVVASEKYNVEIPLTLAIMQNDSAFGTLGIAVQTLNPGNVGNNGTDTRTYPSWQEGVIAVTEWLNRHRVSAAIALTALAITPLVVPDAPLRTELPLSPEATSTPLVNNPPIQPEATSTPPVNNPPIQPEATSTPPKPVPLEENLLGL